MGNKHSLEPNKATFDQKEVFENRNSIRFVNDTENSDVQKKDIDTVWGKSSVITTTSTPVPVHRSNSTNQVSCTAFCHQI